MVVLQTRLYTIADLEALAARPENSDRQFELVHGEIVEKPMPTELHGIIVANLIALLWLYVKEYQRGRVGSEIRNRMPNDDYNSRQPDGSYFIDAARPIVERGAVPRMPDLAIEVKSPDDTYKAMREKADYYLANGARMVWLVFTGRQQIEVHRPGRLEAIAIDGALEGGDVLPGFRAPARDIFPG